MKTAGIWLVLVLTLSLSACTMVKSRLSIADIEGLHPNPIGVDELNINGVRCELGNGKERFEILLDELDAMYNGELYGGEMKFVVLYWYRNGYGGYLCVPPGLTYHSDLFTLGFAGIVELGIATLKRDIITEEIIGFSRYNGHGLCIIGTLENYEFVVDDPREPETSTLGILKEYSYMLGPFKLYTKREFLDFGDYEESYEE